jgi:hypothetical protein
MDKALKFTNKNNAQDRFGRISQPFAETPPYFINRKLPSSC